MTAFPLAAQSYGREGLPRSMMENLYAEATPQGPKAAVRIPRHCLAPASIVGAGPHRAITTHAGSAYVLSGFRMFKDGVDIGTIPGIGLARHDQSDTQLVVVANRKAYLVGDTVSQIVMPNSDGVLDVLFNGGRFVFLMAGSGLYRWSKLNEAQTIDGLAYATAEGDPDPLVGGVLIGNDMGLFGTKTVEWFYNGSNPDSPYLRSQGRSYDKGCIARDTIVKADNSAFFLGDTRIVYRCGAVPERISSNGIEEELSRSEDIENARAFRCIMDGHEFYVLSCDRGTFAFDCQERMWADWSSYGRDRFRVSCTDGDLLGDDATGQLWRFSADRVTDGDDPVTFMVSAFIPCDRKRPCNRIELYTRRGTGGPGQPAPVELRYSMNDGYDWSDWYESDLGAAGEFPRPEWRQLGLVEPPGIMVQFRSQARFMPYGGEID